jgi:hypothetical protein
MGKRAHTFCAYQLKGKQYSIVVSIEYDYPERDWSCSIIHEAEFFASLGGGFESVEDAVMAAKIYLMDVTREQEHDELQDTGSAP